MNELPPIGFLKIDESPTDITSVVSQTQFSSTLNGSESRTTHGQVDSYVELLKLMQLSREGDRRENILVRQGKGWFQIPGAGHEAIAALAGCLEANDYLYPNYRQRSLMLARGISTYEMALTFFAKADSCSAGRLMSNHYSDASRRVMTSATPTGLQCLPAAGTALACKRNQDGAVTICFIGDAALRQGEFYEALCFAQQETLPLLFVVEDNGYGISTPTKKMTPWNTGTLNPSIKTEINGRDAIEVYETSRQLLRKVRSGDGPQVLWMNVDRLWSHTASDDQRIYRSEEELEEIRQRDPIDILRKKLIESGQLSEAAWEEMVREISHNVNLDYQRAELAEEPSVRQVSSFLLEPSQSLHKSHLPPQDSWTMVSAINTTLKRALQQDERVLLFGEDIEDPKGGVFGLSKGLSTLFPDRVTNAPLAEATIAGVAAGVAIAGYRPVFEIQFIDFVGPALNQIVNQLATLSWRSAGQWKCPVVLLAPCGAYLPAGGTWHSQTNEALFAHIPGLKVVEPATPQDAAALLNAAIEDDDPVLFLLPKHLFRLPFPSEPDDPTPLGEAKIRKEGNDVTIVTWGNCVHLSLDVAATLAEVAISVEVIDLRSLVPCDWDAVRRSVTKTGRLVVVHEDNQTCGFGQAILHFITSKPENWDLLYGPPQLVARDDVHIPFNPLLEQAILPSIEKIEEAIRLTLNY